MTLIDQETLECFYPENIQEIFRAIDEKYDGVLYTGRSGKFIDDFCLPNGAYVIVSKCEGKIAVAPNIIGTDMGEKYYICDKDGLGILGDKTLYMLFDPVKENLPTIFKQIDFIIERWKKIKNFYELAKIKDDF